MAQLAQGLRLDLADALAGDVEGAPHLLERVLGAVADAEAHLEHQLLARRQGLQHLAGLVLQVGEDHRLDRRDGVLVLDEVAEMRVLLLADGRLERDRLLGDLHDLPHLRSRQVHALADLLGGGLAAQLLHQRAAGAGELVDGLDHVHRDADGARLVGDGAGDGLPDPPGRVGRELVAAPVLELLDRLHEADVALLDEVEELQPAVGVLLGDRYHQPEVGDDELLLGALADALALADLLDRGSDLGVGGAVALLELAQVGAVLLDAAPVEGLEVLLEAGELAVDVLQEIDQPVARLHREVNGADVLGDLRHQAVDLALDLQELLSLGLAALLALAQLPDVAVVAGDLLEDLQVAADAVRGLGVERLVGVGGDQLAQYPLVALGELVQPQQLAQDDRVLAQRLVDGPLPLLDALGDLHLALAVEERHGAHLPQVHAHGVVGLLVGGETELGRLVLFLVELGGGRLEVVPVLVALGTVDDVDAEIGEPDVDLIQLVGEGDHLLGQHLVDLVVEEIALLLAQLDELLDGGVLLFDVGQAGNGQ